MTDTSGGGPTIAEVLTAINGLRVNGPEPVRAVREDVLALGNRTQRLIDGLRGDMQQRFGLLMDAIVDLRADLEAHSGAIRDAKAWNDVAGSGGDSRLPAPARGRDGGGEFPLSEPWRNPGLDAAQIEGLRKYGTAHDVAAGDVLFADGDETYDLIVMLDGTAEIVKGFCRPRATVIATYWQSQFLGEIGMLTGQRAYLTAVTSSPGRLLVASWSPLLMT